MTPERWRQVTDIFHAALARKATDRANYLDEACTSDRTLREEVDAMLEAHSEGAQFGEAPVNVSAAHRPRLASGAMLGPYRVEELIGTGGMGEVYRARDMRLGRDVAIKVLHGGFTLDPEHLARFEREGRMLAALNHPHIAAIHGLEEVDGIPALVLELVEGPTLADRLTAGPLPLKGALNIAHQIAEALEAAHEKGIIHRDLKPANIKITPDGVIKTLDFGLAKVSSGDTCALDLSQPATVTAAALRDGMIMGTAAYMSPEQARGQAVDKRTDIWAFACVLYEMLTGRCAFSAETLSDTIAAVLERDPDWYALPAHTPPLVRRLLRRALEKDRKRRLADIADARIDIEEALTAPSSDERLTVQPVARFGAGRLAASLATALIVGGIIAGSALWRTTRQPVPRVTRLTMMLSGPAALTINGNDRDLAISPDGSRLVYVGARGSQLFVRAMNELDATPITVAGAPRHPFFSPDGAWIGFFDGDTIKKVATTGGPVVTICSIPPGGPRGAAWGPDGTIVFATLSRSAGLLAVSAAGGQPATLTTLNPERGEANHWWPEFLPGGQGVLFTIVRDDSSDVAVLDRRTGGQKILLRQGSHAHYVPSGHLVYATAGTLRAAAFDLGRLQVQGTPVPVEQVVTTALGAADFDVSHDGTLAYVSGGQALERRVVWVDRQGHEEPIDAPTGAYDAPALSPDGTRLALETRGQEIHIWIWSLARQTLTRFTFARGTEAYPRWTPDGRRLVFASNVPTPPGLFWQPADGTGAAERLTRNRDFPFLSAVSRDSSQIVFSENGDLMVASLRGERQARPLLQTPFNEMNGDISPDGRWLAYQSNESGQFEIYVRPFPDVNSGRWQVSTGGGTRPLWARNGQELFYLAGAGNQGPSGALMSVHVKREASWTADTPTKLFEGGYVSPINGRTYDVSASGQRFVMIKPASEAAPPSIIVVQHWLDELNVKVPVGK